jgi:hypothetical protein
MFLRVSQIALVLGYVGLAVIPASSAADSATNKNEALNNSAPAKPGKLEYNRDVRPILAENCFSCHGPDSASRKAKLRLDDRQVAIERGSIVAGKSKESSMIERILLPDSDELVMPPVKSHKKLKPEQKEILKRWIDEGAEYQSHWSFITPKRPALPTFDDAPGKAWAKNPIDALILAKMREQGFAPAPEADRRTLARRLSFDLTGLPPDPADVAAFEKDQSPDYYEKYVDKLMATTQWGEHRGRYWLDYVRYADTHGIHFDNFREVWSYRDWVIKAFNQNQPFDQFALEQLAGDLIPNATLDQQIATGFNRCNITTSEGGAINEEYLVLYTRDRTEAANQVFMGLTAGCAVCHDHKFDPVSQKEFYSMAAFFNNTTQNAMDGNVQDTPPIVTVPKEEDRKEWEKISVEAKQARIKKNERKKVTEKEFQEWLTKSKPKDLLGKRLDSNLLFYAWLDESAGNQLHAIENGKPTTFALPANAEWKEGPFKVGKALSVKAAQGQVTIPTAGDFDGNKPFSVGLWVQIPQRGQNGSVISRMNIQKGYQGWDIWNENDRFAVHLINNWASNSIKVTTKTGVNVNDWHYVLFTYDGQRTGTSVKLYVDGALQGTATYGNGNNIADDQLANLKAPAGAISTDAPLQIGQRTNGDGLNQVHVQDLRIYDRVLTDAEVLSLVEPVKIAGHIAKQADKRTQPEKDELQTYWLKNNDAAYQQVEKDTLSIFKREIEIKNRGTIAHISVEKMQTPEAFVLNRGEYDQRKDKVTPNTPKALPAFPDDLPKNRLGFAKWLLRADHPLTTRVTVNRFWQELFGAGLVKTSGDFGITGDLPSHPELLDWMSVEFRESGWDMKKFYKLLVTSNTYRQSAVSTKEKTEKDPANKYLSHGARFRMDAEMIRDNALAASGLLVRKIGGPSVKPYQPEGVWEAVAMIGSNTRNYKADQGENLYRRSMYTFWKRSAPPASMEILNAPNRETCTVKRERTNTPLQALVTLNDVQFVEAARVLAEKAIAKGNGNDSEILNEITERIISRKLNTDEQKVVLGTLNDLKTEYKTKPDDAKKLISYGESKPDAKLDPSVLAAWTMVVNELFNLDEVLTK